MNDMIGPSEGPAPAQMAQELAFFVGSAPLLMGTVALGAEGDIIHLYDNAATCRFFGMPYGVTSGRSARSMGVPEEIIGLWRAKYDEAVAAGEAIKFEYSHPGADGARTLAVTVSPLGIQSPHGVCCGYIADDVTEERQARVELAASKERFQAAVRAVEGVLWTNDPEGRMTGEQPGWQALTGQSRDEYEGYGWSKAVHPDDAAPTVVAWQEAVAKREPFVFEHRVRRFDGEWRTFAIRAIPVVSSHDKVQEWVGVHTDVTEQQRTREHLLASEARLRDSEEQLRLATDAAEIGLWDVDLLSGTLFCAPRAKKMFGMGPETAASESEAFFPYVHPEDLARVAEAYAAAIDPEKRAIYDVEYRTIGKDDGVVRWVAAKGRALFSADRECYRVIGTAMDITRRKEAEQALHEQARSLEVLNTTGAALAAELDLEKIVQTVTDAAVELIGAQFGAFLYNVLDEGGARYTLYTISGVPREHFSKFPMPRNTAVFEPTFAGTGIVRSDDITRDPRYGKSAPHHGMPPGHLPVRSYLAVPVRSREGEVLGGLFFGHSDVGVFSALDEDSVAGLSAQAAIAIDNARLFQASQWELSARRKAEDELKSLNDRLEQEVRVRTRERDMVWTTSQDLFAIIGADSCYIAVNPAWSQALGYSHDELIGMHGSTLVHPEDVAARSADFEPMTRGEAVRDVDLRLRTKAGDYKWYSWTAIPTGDGQVYCEGRDVTDRRQLEDQLRQAQKMEAVGQLTGGIAHDFNNLLTGISGSLELLEKRLPEDASPQLHRYLNAAATSAHRAAALTHRLLAFSRRQPLDPKPVNANQLVASMDDLLRRTIGENIQLNIVTEGGLWRTLCDPHQLESAVLNLAINARDAMPTGGKLTVETCNVDLDSAVASRIGDLKPGRYICVCVTDTGAGMPPDVIEKAFEPFFTTKPIGQGTGLGLSMIYGFTRQSGGHAKIYSEVGKGTSVKLYLPRFDGSADDGDHTTSRAPIEAHRAPGGETVLVVEDEQSVRELVVEILTDLNYRTIEAVDGPSGLRALEEADAVDLLITDVGLPGLNGRQLADAARIGRPDLKVLFMTGYAENAAVQHGFLDPGMEMITKPFPLETFASRVRRMIVTN